MLVSEQEGAEIWINNKNSGLKTPAFVKVRQHEVNLIRLRKPGYQDHVVSLVSRQPTTYYYTSLKRPVFYVVPNIGKQA